MSLMKLLIKVVLSFLLAYWSASYQMKLLLNFLIKVE